MYRRATRRVHDDLERLVDDLRRRLDVRLRPAAARFRRVVETSLRLPWFSYARSLFNKTARLTAPTNSTRRDAVSFLIPPATSAFAEFLRVYNVEEVERWHRRFSEG